ncbi:hypothetical protein [uncultured Brevundimonas sp.]|uniref:hypothetical protein n=1 Tax=uncultured Brevundimonas sp. TaxID=213418 RepID=UPI0030EC0FB4|tara:strand:- start:84 stop:494 length:411 start_codon:yes stop_codon:yes gene_type:complete
MRTHINNTFAEIQSDVLRALDGIGVRSIDSLRDLTERRYTADQLQAAVRNLVAEGRVAVDHNKGIHRPDAAPNCEAANDHAPRPPRQPKKRQPIDQLAQKLHTLETLARALDPQIKIVLHAIRHDLMRLNNNSATT